MLDFLQSRRMRLLWTALIHIGAAARPVSGKELSGKLDCSRRYLESDLQRLAQHGLLESRRGAHGGYSLARSPYRINLLDVLNALQDGQDHEHPTSSCPLQQRIVLPQLKQAGDMLAASLADIRLADALVRAADAGLVPASGRTADFSI